LKRNNSTIFESIITIRKSSGELFIARHTAKDVIQMDLPEPVAPAINKCGIRERSATNG
jgi:hypothetical protein